MHRSVAFVEEEETPYQFMVKCCITAQSRHTVIEACVTVSQLEQLCKSYSL